MNYSDFFLNFGWQFWLIVGFLLLIAEIFTPGFLLACFGVAALITTIPALFGVNVIWLIIIFAVSSVLSLLLLRPIMLRLWKDPEVKTGADALIGRRAKVTEEINESLDTGRVAVDGDNWRAHAENLHEIIPKGATVEIMARTSIELKVKLIN